LVKMVQRSLFESMICNHPAGLRTIIRFTQKASKLAASE
jgi:hypothetical protein